MANESGLEVISAVAGRIRLRITDEETRAAIEAAAPTLRQQEGVRQVRINKQTGSLLVNFDPDRVQLSQLWEGLQQWGISQVEAASENGQSDRCLQAYEQVLSFVPSIIGILVTRWLGVQGWKIVPTYLLSAGTTRQFMNQLDLGLPAFLAGEGSQPTTDQASGQLALPSEVDNQVGCEVVSAVPGRIRFHVPRVANDTDYAERLRQLAQADDKITAIRINRLSRSVVLTYESHRLSDTEAGTHLSHLIQAAGKAEAATKNSTGSEGEGQAFEGSNSSSTTVNLTSPSTQAESLPEEPASEDQDFPSDSSLSQNQAESEMLSEPVNQPETSVDSPTNNQDSEAADPSAETQQQVSSENSSFRSQASTLSGMLRLMAKLPRQQA